MPGVSARSGWRVNPGTSVSNRFRAVPRTDTPRHGPDPPTGQQRYSHHAPHPRGPPQAPGTRHPAPGTRHPAPGTRHPAQQRRGARPREPGAGPFRPRGGTAMQHREGLDQPKRPEM
ncbi:hypothetical protein GCM10020295_45150 [Streptomyces cinereospinus]